MKISIIIPTFDRTETLPRAINSVLAQTHTDFELWIVDDGSTDDTKSMVLNYQHDPRVFYVRTENRGVSAARNVGIEKSSGDWIALLDSDDEWLPHKLEAQVKFINEHPDIPLVHGEELWFRNGVRVNPMDKHKKFGGQIFEKCVPLCLISPSAAIFKRSLIEEVGGFDEDFIVCEDYDLWLKITSMTEVGFIDDPVIIKHGGHDDQLSRKYVAMDYWRVKALDRITKLRELSDEQYSVVAEELKKKAEILLQGYEKHGNMDDHAEIKTILGQYS